MTILWLASHARPAGTGTAASRMIPPWRGAVPDLLWMAVALSPVLWWFVLRLDDGSDEPFGLFALAFALGIAWRDRHSLHAASRARAVGAALILASVIGIGTLPPMLRAILAVTGTAAWLGFHRHAGLMGLLILSLPVVASLEFYAAYPMRLAAAEGTVRLLELGGLTVGRTGVNIDLGGAVVAVDPACSGIRMLWFAAAATMALAAIHRTSWRTAITGGALAATLVIPANILRAAWLALGESGRFNSSWIGHSGIGLLCFGAVLIPLSLFMARHGRNPEPRSLTSPTPASAHRLGGWLLVLSAILVPVMLFHSPAIGKSTPQPPAVPETFTFNGLTLPLEALPRSTAEDAFAKSFPGSLGSHRWGGCQVILRTAHKPTRRLHPSRDCLRAAGYRTTDAITVTSRDGGDWSRFTAIRGASRLIVHERIVSEQTGEVWTDVTAWYWAALRHPLNGPWRAETVISE